MWLKYRLKSFYCNITRLIISPYTWNVKLSLTQMPSFFWVIRENYLIMQMTEITMAHAIILSYLPFFSHIIFQLLSFCIFEINFIYLLKGWLSGEVGGEEGEKKEKGRERGRERLGQNYLHLLVHFTKNSQQTRLCRPKVRSLELLANLQSGW